MEKPELTPRQQEIFEFIRDQITNGGWPPTVREIGQKTGIKSPNGVMCHLRALENKGYITRGSKVARCIRLTERQEFETEWYEEAEPGTQYFIRSPEGAAVGTIRRVQ